MYEEKEEDSNQMHFLSVRENKTLFMHDYNLIFIPYFVHFSAQTDGQQLSLLILMEKFSTSLSILKKKRGL